MRSEICLISFGGNVKYSEPLRLDDSRTIVWSEAAMKMYWQSAARRDGVHRMSARSCSVRVLRMNEFLPGPRQLKEQAGFLVSRSLTLPSALCWARGFHWWFSLPPKKNNITFTSGTDASVSILIPWHYTTNQSKKIIVKYSNGLWVLSLTPYISYLKRILTHHCEINLKRT